MKAHFEWVANQSHEHGMHVTQKSRWYLQEFIIFFHKLKLVWLSAHQCVDQQSVSAIWKRNNKDHHIDGDDSHVRSRNHYLIIHHTIRV